MGGFSGIARGLMVGRIMLEAMAGCPIALVKDNDQIVIDVANGNIVLLVSEKDLNKRRKDGSQ